RADLEKLTAKQAGNLQDELRGKAIEIRGVNVIAAKVSLSDPKALKTLVFNLEKELAPSAIIVGADVDGKPQLMLAISKELTGEQLDAGKFIRQAASFIKGGGGGQPFFATAGGSDTEGLDTAVSSILEWVKAGIEQ
nr:alanine--tRNA ligase [Saprospiraceae bacterium]